jgi:hypothetical protein
MHRWNCICFQNEKGAWIMKKIFCLSTGHHL